MGKLMKLEWKKFKLGSLIKGSLFTILVIFSIIVLILFMGRKDGSIIFDKHSELITFISISVMSTFIIYGSAVLAELTVSEYKNKTIQLMFMYPIDRKRLFIGKLIIVYGFTAIAVLLGNIFIICGIYLLDHIIDVVPRTLDLSIIVREWKVLVSTVGMSGFLAIAPVYLGMRKKSTVVTIISSVIIVSLLTSGGGNSIEDMRFLMRVLVLGAAAIVSVILSLGYTLNNIDTVGME